MNCAGLTCMVLNFVRFTCVTGEIVYYIYVKTFSPPYPAKIHGGITPQIYNYYTNLTPYGTFQLHDKIVKIEAKACRDSCILLSVSEDLRSNTFYEVCFAQIGRMLIVRRGYSKGFVLDLGTHYEEYLLNCTEYSLLWIFFDGNTIKPGIGEPVDKDLAVVSVEDYMPFGEVRGIGVMTSFNIDGLWRFPVNVDPKGYFCRVEKTKANMTVIGYRSVTKRTFCTLDCQQNNNCIGFNYRVDGRNNCELIYGSQHVVMEENLQWTFYSKCLLDKKLCLGCRI